MTQEDQPHNGHKILIARKVRSRAQDIGRSPQPLFKISDVFQCNAPFDWFILYLYMETVRLCQNGFYFGAAFSNTVALARNFLP
jgi:hypothetical protein